MYHESGTADRLYISKGNYQNNSQLTLSFSPVKLRLLHNSTVILITHNIMKINETEKLYLKPITGVLLAKPQEILCFYEAVAILVASFEYSF